MSSLSKEEWNELHEDMTRLGVEDNTYSYIGYEIFKKVNGLIEYIDDLEREAKVVFKKNRLKQRYEGKYDPTDMIAFVKDIQSYNPVLKELRDKVVDKTWFLYMDKFNDDFKNFLESEAGKHIKEKANEW